MNSKILESIGIDPFYILVVMFMLIVLLFVLVIGVNMKYNRLKANYNSFMRGKDGKTLEKSILSKFKEIDALSTLTKRTRQEVKEMSQKMAGSYQKVGIVKYDAFNEMGGKLSFALTLLDGDDNGYIINAMHSREGCYLYIKEIVKGESYIELAEEEAESLERAIYKETYGLDI